GADTPELIKSIRETTGEELDWFFREWLFMTGRPDYRVEASYDATKKTEKVSITQTQHSDAETPVFDMPIELAFYGANGERRKTQVRDICSSKSSRFHSISSRGGWISIP